MITFKIAEISVKDAGKGLGRVDPKDMHALGIAAFDLIEIGGKRKTVVRAMPLEKSQRGQSLIQVDGITRENARVGIDDSVFVKKVESKQAIKVVLAPTSADLLLNGDNTDYLVSRLDGIPVTVGDRVRITLPGLRIEDFQVLGAIPAESIVVRSATKIELRKKPKGKVDSSRVTYEDVGGLKEQIRKVREMVELPLRYPQVFERLGIDPPRGVLLLGPPGSGKTLLAKAVAHETNVSFQAINGPEIIHKFYGESEARLRDIFEIAERNQPSIIFLDEIDAIAPKREKVSGEVEKRVVAQLLALMDGLKDRGRVIVVGATNLPSMLDSALRRPGRFDREVSLDVPDRNGRLEIFEVHTRGMPLADDVDLERLADITHGFVGADIENLCREAAMRSIRTMLPDIDFEGSNLPYDKLMELRVEMEDFIDALRGVEPSAIREIFVEIPKVNWKDIGGLDEIKERLTEAVIWPIKYRELFEATQTKAPKGILLYGPPGNGKTLLAKAIANESGVNFISIKGAELLSKYVGESEHAVREVFKKAKQVAPCIVFFDEIDAIAPCRAGGDNTHVSERVVSQLLIEMDGVEELRGILVLAATNRIDMVDPALLRAGRFDLSLKIPYPDEEALFEILCIHTRGKPLARDVNLREIAGSIKGLSGADIELLCQRASLIAIREHLSRGKGVLRITYLHFEEALKEASGKVKGPIIPTNISKERFGGETLS
ncbi:MAG: ATPase AAA, transitional endoplasmic reticulum ATPase [Candidatus Dadabacteria bacterium CSP1-2]|jgi:transitional endoplasmic reticulum ATPase|nr:MAG: ATPase AAA, transitional endoplasmic reticulum ATPase [Candidatus Dadabacteria bacterium CSP1-2]